MYQDVWYGGVVIWYDVACVISNRFHSIRFGLNKRGCGSTW